MNIEDLTNPLVRDAITALNALDREGWFAGFSSETEFTDDGEKREFVTWSDDEIFEDGHAHITAITREDDHGHTIYTRMRSDTWGELDTYWKFTIHNGEITRLDVGEA